MEPNRRDKDYRDKNGNTHRAFIHEGVPYFALS
jgi:hypothetical protein